MPQAIHWSNLLRPQSILRQFLIPILSAVLLTGVGVASVSKWAADRASRQSSATRLQSIGELVVQAPFPKTANVLEQLHELTGLEFAWFEKEQPKDDHPAESNSQSWILDQSTLAIDPEDERWIRQSLDAPHRLGTTARGNTASTVEAKLIEGMIQGESLRLLSVAAEDARLLVMEPAARRGDEWMVFALPLVTGLLSSIGIAIVAAWTASRLSDRVERLRIEVAKIAEGNFDHPPASGPEDDIRSLQSSLHRMGEQLEESQKQIAQNERSRLIHMLGSGLAHELRNHLTGARLALQTIAPNDPNEESIGVALKQLDLAESQIKRLLAVRSRTSNDSSSPMAAGEINRTVTELVKPMATHRHVTLDVFPPIGDTPAASDSIGREMVAIVPSGQSMVSVILNLLVNAIEAVGVGGKVRLEFEYQNNPILLGIWRVKDDGPGPSSDIASTMFEPFATTKPEGVGLGLSMCQQIVQALGGTIRWFRESNQTVFEVSIPLESSHVSN
ncbi:ATP-binding protein [Pirellulaceae bacterium SH501]